MMPAARTFATAIRQQPIDLAQAALLLARELAYPDLDIPQELQTLNSLAEQASRAIPNDGPVLTRAVALSDFLFGQLGFTGNQSDYYNPCNSYLNAVIRQRTGIPITLSVLYVALAERLNIPATGVNLPGHFIVRVGPPNLALWLDPFNRGRVLRQEDCLELVQHTTGLADHFEDNWLEPVPVCTILTRMLNNLRGIYLRQANWPLAQRSLERLRLVTPNDLTVLRDLGVVYSELNRPHVAALMLNDYLRHAPNTPDAPQVQQHLRMLFDEIARNN